MDSFFNKWTRDVGSVAWIDDHGGKTLDIPKYIIMNKLYTLDGRSWSLKSGIYWANTEGELRLFRPAMDSGRGWRNDFFQAWESNDGELTLEWPSRKRLPPCAASVTPAGQSMPETQTQMDSFFHTWTREKSGEWVDEYGGRADCPKTASIEMRTTDGKVWCMRREELWISKGGECQRQRPPAAAAGGWSQQGVKAWVSSDGDLCLGWPSKVMQEQQRGAAAASEPDDSTPRLRCADEADALAAIRLRRGRAGGARAVDALLREALLRQAERVALERRDGGAPDALRLTREDLVGQHAKGVA